MGWPKGVKVSEELRVRRNALISLAKRGHQVSTETRDKISRALTGRPCTLSQDALATRGRAISKAKKGVCTEAMARAAKAVGLAKRGTLPWNAGLITGPLSADHRAKIGAGCKTEADRKRSIGQPYFSEAVRQRLSVACKATMIAQWDNGRRPTFQSKLEKRAGVQLAPLGFVKQFILPGYRHRFDYGHAEWMVLVEVNGCFWHAHTCGVSQARKVVHEDDARHAAVAQALGYTVMVLWECEEIHWPTIINQLIGERRECAR